MRLTFQQFRFLFTFAYAMAAVYYNLDYLSEPTTLPFLVVGTTAAYVISVYLPLWLTTLAENFETMSF